MTEEELKQRRLQFDWNVYAKTKVEAYKEQLRDLLNWFPERTFGQNMSHPPFLTWYDTLAKATYLNWKDSDLSDEDFIYWFGPTEDSEGLIHSLCWPIKDDE